MQCVSFHIRRVMLVCRKFLCCELTEHDRVAKNHPIIHKPFFFSIKHSPLCLKAAKSKHDNFPVPEVISFFHMSQIINPQNKTQTWWRCWLQMSKWEKYVMALKFDTWRLWYSRRDFKDPLDTVGEIEGFKRGRELEVILTTVLSWAHLICSQYMLG